jgi:isoquinoline 1-oxidoreductase beta subunit
MAIEYFIASGEDRQPSVSRRTLLKASGASLVVGFWSPPLQAAGAAATPAAPYVANAFVTIGADDSVTLTMAKIEMGQGTYTSIPMLLAEELEVDVTKVKLRHAPPDAKTYGIPFGDQFTGGSTSVRTLYKPMRQAGAAARIVLIQAAADQWKVEPATCSAENGQVVHKATSRRVSYGKLVARAAQLPLPKDVPLKEVGDFKVIGKPVKRLDAKGKVDGSAVYGIDAIVPGMKFASVVNSPVAGGKVKSVDDSASRAMRGVRDVVVLDNAVAVIADNTWYARQAAAALKIEWDEGPNSALATDDLRQLMLETLKKTGAIARNDGDALKTIAEDPKHVESVYFSQMLAHAAMEPVNATVHVRPDGAEIWTGTQVPARTQAAAAKLLGLPPETIVVNNFLLGGGFGRRLYHDQVDQAVLIGKRVEGPVKVTWTREEDIQHDVFRGFYAHAISASLDERGVPVALSHKIAGPSSLGTFAPGFIGPDGVDFDAVENSKTLAYDIPGRRTEFVREEGPVVTGFWRGVGPTRNVSVIEGFIDELAVRAGRDPVEYRLAMLTKNERARNVVSRAAQLSGWEEKLPSRRGKGVALLSAFDTYIAQVVDLSVDPGGKIKVNRVTCVVDCGLVVNPDTVVAQMQGGINFGLTAAMFGEITLKGGRVQQSNFHDYPPLRMNEAPPIQVEIVRSTEAPGGIGEPGTSAAMAAFSNAVFAATGKRLYILPAKPDQLAAS